MTASNGATVTQAIAGGPFERGRTAWLGGLAATLVLAAYCLPRLSSGFDAAPALWLGEGMRYGDSFLFAYPLPIYLPFAPLGLLPNAVAVFVMQALCLVLLAAGLWLWGARKAPLFAVAMLSPVALGVLVNANFNAAVALFGVGLAVEARLRRWPALVGIGLALSLWRPANCLPVIAIFLVAGWSRRDLLVAVGSGALLMLPLTLLAFAISPEWISTYRQELAAILGWSGLGPHLLHGFGPVAYGAAQAAVAVAGWWVLRRRNLRDAAAFTLALSVLLATVAGAYSGSLALPAVIVAATSDLRYRALPLVSNVFGWAITTALLTSGFAVGVVAYWYMIQAYPLLRRLPIAGEDRVLARPVPE